MRRIAHVTLLPALLFALVARAQSPVNPITTVAGGGANSSVATSALIPLPSGVAADNGGNLFVVSNPLFQVYKVSPSGSLALVAGRGTLGFSGDGGPATEAMLGSPEDVYEESKKRLDVYRATVSKFAAEGKQPKGFILGSGCEVPLNSPHENVQAMVDAARIYGQNWPPTNGHAN